MIYVPKLYHPKHQFKKKTRLRFGAVHTEMVRIKQVTRDLHRWIEFIFDLYQTKLATKQNVSFSKKAARKSMGTEPVTHNKYSPDIEKVNYKSSQSLCLEYP